MYVFHGGWIPAAPEQFDNPGRFVFWVETEGRQKVGRGQSVHPCHLTPRAGLDGFFITTLPLSKPLLGTINPGFIDSYWTLPSSGSAPLPSPEMGRIRGELPPEDWQWQSWRVTCLSLTEPLQFLKELSVLALYHADTFTLGSDLRFWMRYAQALRELVRKQQYIPALKLYRQAPRGRRKAQEFIVPGWEPLAPDYPEQLKQFAQAMPLLCTAGTLERPKNKVKDSVPQAPQLLDPKQLLRHFSEQMLDTLVEHSAVTQKLRNQLKGTLLEPCLQPGLQRIPIPSNDLSAETWRQWRVWREGLLVHREASGFTLVLRLNAADPDTPDAWGLEFLVESARDPSLKLSLADYWTLSPDQRKPYASFLQQGFERDLLVALGHAARICPLLWSGLETDHPQGIGLDMATAFDFLRDDAWVLEEAGFKVAVPAWWTPKGRQRARIRVRSSSKSVAQDGGAGWFGSGALVQYRYRLAVGDQEVSEQEWQALVAAKTPLVHFRGQWMELDQGQMQEMLAFWQQHQGEDREMSVLEMLQRSAEADDEAYEFSHDAALTDMLDRLADDQRLELLDSPTELQGELRGYQRRGLSWLSYLEALGLNPCLADDMGLGKTIQVIALLLHERELQPQPLPPTLLIAPTSVLGNWQKEVERFAPRLRTRIHHGAQRARDNDAFAAELDGQDMLITSFALARRDAKLLQDRTWRRIVVDEAQNIKNPKSAQTRAIGKLQARHRLALTGTPIENRLLDLWSIFNFLNPGYLGSSAQFRKRYETPIERDSDALRSAQLKKLVTPFILRRMKTDKAIIDDLPDKVEQKVYCNLTPEQASLYQAVVDEVEEDINETEGIQRKGLILSTLTRLKQICNHPAQFLQDGSAFSTSRSHKLDRVSEMLAESLEEGDSLLVFSQFTEIGAALEGHIREHQRCPVYYLHGGTSRSRRERMIAEFQDPATPPAVFILSLKAGGVGITLTKANHVFHFDRWWNPAVENQATDRAFRIGQTKKVFAHKMVTLGTLEERIDEMLEHKQRLADSIVGQDEAWLTELDNDAFRALIRLNRDSVLEA